MGVDLTLTDPKDHWWKDRAEAAEEALRTMTQCFAILCDRADDETITITDDELIKIEGRPILITLHDKEKAEMQIRHVKE